MYATDVRNHLMLLAEERVLAFENGLGTDPAYMADLDPDGRDIPLYAQDGVTVIGSFHIGPGRVATPAAPGAPEAPRS